MTREIEMVLMVLVTVGVAIVMFYDRNASIARSYQDGITEGLRRAKESAAGDAANQAAKP